MNRSLITIERFWSKVDKLAGPRGCWPWTAAMDKRGYGRSRWGLDRSAQAHRIAYQLEHPDEDISGKVIRHTCDNPSCCNPKHLRAGTQKDNVYDMYTRDRQVRGEAIARSKRGERNSRGKLKAEYVREIRRRAAAGVSRKLLAEKFCVSRPTIDGIINRQYWSHI